MRKNPDPPMAIHLDLCVLRYNWAPILRLTYLFPCILSSAGPNALPIISLKSQARVPVLQKSERRFEMVRCAPKSSKVELSGCVQILRSTAMATRMHRLFKPSLQRLMRGRRLKAPRLHRNGERGDNNHDHHSGSNPALSSARGVADLALQPWLGILSQQRSGSGCVGPRNSFAPRAHITPGLFSLASATLFEARGPGFASDAVSFLDRPCVNGH